MYVRLLYSCLWVQSVLPLACCNLHSKFKKFDELTPDNFTVVVKRDALSGQVHLKIVTFFALRKYFVLHLVPGSPVLRKDFEAHMVDADGRMTPVHVDQQIFYTGYLNDNPQHSVDAVHTDHVWLAQIHGPDDVYSIEPLTHHVPDSPTTSMLIFKQRDINSSIFMNHGKENATLQPFCEEVQFKQSPLSDLQGNRQRSHNKNNNSINTNLYKRETKSVEKDIKNNVENKIFKKHDKSETHSFKDKHYEMQFIEHKNLRRESIMKNKYTVHDTCEILVIADFETYKGAGKSNALRTISILVYLYQSVDRIFRGTYFGTLTNRGLVIARIIVHTEYTIIVDGKTHYNMPNNTMSLMETLESMATVSNFTNFCLVHLTTQRNFSGTLGVAAIPEYSDTWEYGICAMSLNESRNTGLSTQITAKGEVMPLRMYRLVIAHEIGHNWGADHDPPDDKTCSPSSKDGGKYIMWAYSGHATSFNSRKFSPCSRREIGTVLSAKAHLCFMPRSRALKVCGNLIVDPGEDCDVGYVINDDCCTSRCSFAENAVCSPFNHPCCTNSCQIAPPTQKCFVDFQDCHENTFCSGTEFHTCPQSQPLPNNSTCQSQGKCWHGECVSFCELLGATFNPARRLVDCSCDIDRITMCFHCCWDPESKQGCIPMGGFKIDGSPCMMGFCNKGICDNIKTDVAVSRKTSYVSSGSNDIHQLGCLNAVFLTVTTICLESLAAII